MNEILQRGCLIHYSCSIWGGRVKLPKSAITVDADPDFYNATKYLIDRNYLQPLESVRSEARGYLYKKTLPFPIPGILFVPKDMGGTIDEKMGAYQSRFNEQVEAFAGNYETFIEQARRKLGTLFNPIEYPRNIRRHFSFTWRLYNFDAPDRIQVFSPEIYEQAVVDYQQTMSEFQETAVITLRTTFSEMVDHIVERLSGERKTFRDSLVGNIREFLADFSALNITNDTELAHAVERCRRILDGVNPDAIRSNSAFRHHIAGSMSQVKTQLDKMMVSRPLRRIRVA
ncbi:MAG: DUF3150 domain-containing protein [Candidatus Brocadiaceae bacterium]|nr:DUF3150 domain-containing protein [Candidatus Brocadiaceae bacterium]